MPAHVSTISLKIQLFRKFCKILFLEGGIHYEVSDCKTQVDICKTDLK